VAPAHSTKVLLVTPRDPQDPIRRALTDAGYPVVEANSAPVAMQGARHNEPGIIVADPRALTPSGRNDLSSFAAECHIPLIVGWTGHESLLKQVEQTIGPPEPPEEQSQKLVVGSLQMDLATRIVQLGEGSLDLTPREFELLGHFVRHPTRVYSRQELLERVWGYEHGDPQVVTVHIANLRKKARAVDPEYKLVETVHAIGYRFVVPPTAKPEDRAGLASDAGSISAGYRGGLVRWGPHTVTERDEQGNVFWQATWWVMARQGGEPYGRWGSEVMDWTVTLPPPTAPPLGRNETADLVYVRFDRVDDASVATVIFRFDTKDWPHPGHPFEPFPNPVYHKFVLTKNPGSESDHVEGYALAGAQPDPDRPWGLKFMDIDCSGIQIFYYPPRVDRVNAEATSTT
jgi:DNA-binding response OmpR family regulator